MRENIITCDICRKLLQSTASGMCDSFETEFESVTFTIIHNDKKVSYDLCPRCKKRMEKYLRKYGHRLDE